jgi:acetyltransferase-like isoleucine patch superfamily enzyme
MINNQTYTKGDIIIGNNAWMGYEVAIIPGAKIGDGAVIVAKAVDAKEVAIYVIVADNPTREIQKRFNDATAKNCFKFNGRTG